MNAPNQDQLNQSKIPNSAYGGVKGAGQKLTAPPQAGVSSPSNGRAGIKRGGLPLRSLTPRLRRPPLSRERGLAKKPHPCYSVTPPLLKERGLGGEVKGTRVGLSPSALLRAGLILALALPGFILAQSIPAGVVSGGSGTIGVAGSYSITGTVGQPAVGSITRHEAGFWPAAQELTKAAGGLSGTLVIGPDAGDDYANFTDAVAALTTEGISAPVNFQVKAGTYTEQVTLGPISGTNAANTITFEPITGDADTVYLEYTATGSADNWVVKLDDGAQYITITGLNIQATGTTYSRVIQIFRDADHCRILRILCKTSRYRQPL